MSFWPLFWTIVFAGAIGCFALLSIAVTIGGFFDIRLMLQALRKAHQSQSDAADTTDSNKV